MTTAFPLEVVTAEDLAEAAKGLLSKSGFDADNNELDLLPEGEQLVERFENRFGFAGSRQLLKHVTRLHQTIVIEIEADLELRCN